MPVIEKTLEILNLRGLHARAAARFVRIVEAHKAEVTVEKDDMAVCGSSIMGLLMLAAGQHTHIRVTTRGDNAEIVAAELERLVKTRFGEEE